MREESASPVTDTTKTTRQVQRYDLLALHDDCNHKAVGRFEGANRVPQDDNPPDATRSINERTAYNADIQGWRQERRERQGELIECMDYIGHCVQLCWVAQASKRNRTSAHL